MKPVKHKIKTVIIAVLIIITSLCFITILVAQIQKEKSNNLNKPKQELQLIAQINENKKAFNVGEPILLNLTVKNNDDADLFILQSCVSLDYKLTVKNERGQLVSLTEQGQRLTNRSDVFCSLKKVKIEPSNSKQVNINLLSLYDMSTKGKYYVSASRSARKIDEKWIRAESNTIQVVIR